MRSILVLPFVVAFVAQAEPRGLEGYWREPTGAVLHIETCGDAMCIRIATIQPGAPSTFDIHNPDPAEHSHSLCDKVIGTEFHRTSPDHAEDGVLYDPKTGKTYRGEMTAAGDTLHLRGYLGIKAFGRSQDWTRIPPPLPCKPG